MIRHIIFLITAIFFLSTVPAVLATTIELDDGSCVIGDIVHETESEIIVSRDGGKVIQNIPRKRVRGVRESTLAEIGSQNTFLSRAKGAWSGVQRSFNRWRVSRKSGPRK